jgi:CDP-diacylglycerol pyrophosphatase
MTLDFGTRAVKNQHMKRNWIYTGVGVLALSGIALGFVWRANGAGNSNALWRIVHDQCVPMQVGQGRASPCRFVDLAGRYAVLKDLHGRTQFLVLPTDRITGIESPELLRPGSPNYWQAAWVSRRYVEENAGQAIARDGIGLAINSAYRRSQNQLHIHIDCVRASLHAALEAHEQSISERWPQKPVMLAGRAYYVMKILRADMDGVDPFVRLAQRLANPATQMGGQVLAAVGAQFADGTPGFYVLDSPAGTQGATSDDILDRSCDLLRTRAQSTRSK